MIMCPFLLGNIDQIFKKGEFDRISIFREGLLGKRECFFQGGWSSYIKNNLKYQILTNKKSLETKMFLYVITKNLNWEVLTKNLVTFKRWNGMRMKNFSIMGVHWKIWFLEEEGLTENQYIWGSRLKRGELGHISNLS